MLRRARAAVDHAEVVVDRAHEQLVHHQLTHGPAAPQPRLDDAVLRRLRERLG